MADLCAPLSTLRLYPSRVPAHESGSMWITGVSLLMTLSGHFLLDLGPRLIVDQFVIRHGWQAIGYVPQARDHVAHHWHASNHTSANSDQHQWLPDDQPDDAATHGPHAPAVCEC